MNATTENTFPNLIIRASAGTGKTFQLSNRFLALITGDLQGNEILATTFTRKAAGEILDRVLVRLARAATSEEECHELTSQIQFPTLTTSSCGVLLQSLLKNVHRLRVGTLDSFFGQVARSRSLELGISPGWQIVDQLDDNRLRSEAVDNMFGQDQPHDLRTLLNLLTKGETDRGISELVRQTVDELYELFKETESDAWKNLPRYKPLSESQLADVLEDLRCFNIEKPSLSGARDKDYTNAIDGQWQDLIKKGIAAKVADGTLLYSRQPVPPELAAIYKTLIEHAKAELVGRVAMQTEATYDLLERFHAEYERLKQEARVMRFEDVTARVAAAAQELYEPLSYRLDSRVDHLLLDEFQDTSPIQWRAIRPFALRSTMPKDDRSFFCVGDMKQAIYGWRGGVAEIFDAVADELVDLQEQSLNKSYRSSQVIIDTVNSIFSGITRHPNLGRAESGVKKWCSKFEKHVTARDELPGYAVLLTAPLNNEDQSGRDAVFECAASQVETIVAQSPQHSVGVLVRTNDHVARLIYLLHDRGVLASEEGGNPLTDSAAVNLVLSLLRLADHPGNQVARFHLATSPLGRAIDFQDHADRQSAYRLSKQLREEFTNEGYGPVVYRYAQHLVANCNRRELKRLEQLVELAYAHSANRSLRMSDFVQLVETQRITDPSSANVRVMTIHQAKGLEFDIVVLPDLDADIVRQSGGFVVQRDTPTSPAKIVCRHAAQEIQQLMPKTVQKMFDESVQRDVSESMCALYVAITRSVHALHMIIPPSAANEKNMPRKFSGLLRAALHNGEPVKPQSTIIEQGNPQWHERTRKTETSAQIKPPTDASTNLKSNVIKLSPIIGPRHRGLERTSPSRLEGGSRIAAKDLFADQGSDARRRGTLIHAWFEQIQWLDDGQPDDDLLLQVASKTPDMNFTEAELKAEIASFRSMLAKPNCANSLMRSNYRAATDQGGQLRVENEFPISFRDQDRLVTGNIDRLVVTTINGKAVAADILDYKTDAFASYDDLKLSKKYAFYEPQITTYMRATSKMMGIDPNRISAKLLFLEAGCVLPISIGEPL